MAKSERGVAVASAVAVATSLVSRREARARSRMQAYRDVGAQIGRSAGWVRKLVAGGVKDIGTEIKGRLDALLVRELEAEMARLHHELENARQAGDHPASRHVAEIENLLSQARSLLNGGGE